MDPTVEDSSDSMVGECVEIHYTPWTYSHHGDRWGNRTMPVEPPNMVSSTFWTTGRLHLLFVALMFLPLILPVILWTLPTTTVLERSASLYYNGLSYLSNGCNHLFQRTNKLLNGFSFVLAVILSHLSCTPTLLMWFLCWMINVALQPTIGNSTRPNDFRHWTYPRAQLRTRSPQSFYCFIVLSLCRLLGLVSFAPLG